MTFSGKSPTGPRPHDETLVEEATTWFVRLRSDGAGDGDRRDFEAWLRRDPAHADAYAQAEALWDEIGGMPDPRTGPTGRQPDATVRRAAPSRPRRRRPLRHGALAAGLALVAVVGAWSIGGYDRLRADHATAVGEIRSVTLSDGSAVELNTDTALAVDITDHRRRIELFRGEAFFIVAPDANRPFEVVAGPVLSRAVGTAFNVADGGRSVTVAVDEGRVRVARLPAGRNAEDGPVLGVGQAARYGDGGGIEVGPVDVAATTSWRRGKLVFVNRPLRDVVDEIDRYRPGAIFFLDSVMAGARFTGMFNLRDTDAALAAIGTALDIDVVQVTPYLTLLRARK